MSAYSRWMRGKDKLTLAQLRDKHSEFKKLFDSGEITEEQARDWVEIRESVAAIEHASNGYRK